MKSKTASLFAVAALGTALFIFSSSNRVSAQTATPVPLIEIDPADLATLNQTLGNMATDLTNADLATETSMPLGTDLTGGTALTDTETALNAQIEALTQENAALTQQNANLTRQISTLTSTTVAPATAWYQEPTFVWMVLIGAVIFLVLCIFLLIQNRKLQSQIKFNRGSTPGSGGNSPLSSSTPETAVSSSSMPTTSIAETTNAATLPSAVTLPFGGGVSSPESISPAPAQDPLLPTAPDLNALSTPTDSYQPMAEMPAAPAPAAPEPIMTETPVMSMPPAAPAAPAAPVTLPPLSTLTQTPPSGSPIGQMESSINAAAVAPSLQPAVPAAPVAEPAAPAMPSVFDQFFPPAGSTAQGNVPSAPAAAPTNSTNPGFDQTQPPFGG